MSDYAKMTFEFGREMGARLRALRKAREVAEIAADAFNTCKVKLPPAPRPA